MNEEAVNSSSSAKKHSNFKRFGELLRHVYVPEMKERLIYLANC